MQYFMSHSLGKFFEDIHLIQAHHVAETSVLSGGQVLWKMVVSHGDVADLDLLFRLREISHEPQNDPPQCQ